MNNRFGFGALHSLTQRSRIERVWIAGLWAMLAAMPALAEQSEVKPQIAENSVSIVKKENSPLVEISYTLTGEPAIVTIAIETNTLADASGEWIAVDGKGVGMLLGEANKIVYTLDAPSKAYWNVAATFNGSTFNPGSVRATVTAWPTNNPPNYMVVELNPTNDYERLFLKRRYYTTTNELPGGFEHVQYKTSKLLMRKIPAKDVVWWMGSPMRIGDEGWETTNDVPHKVMLTEDYYAGVYELTIGQLKTAEIYDKFFETNFTDFAQSDVVDLLPAERIGHHIVELRGLIGYKKGYPKVYYAYWEQGHSVSEDSVIDRLRKRTGISDLDLPTEAQWEYACRAGIGGALPCNIENISGYACFSDNQYYHANKRRNGPSPVGLFSPNDWGLYDTLGNISEICLDLTGINDYLPDFKASLTGGWDNIENPAISIDPYGPKKYTATYSMIRGGNWRNKSWGIADRFHIQANYKCAEHQGVCGVRLFCSVKEAVK